MHSKDEITNGFDELLSGISKELEENKKPSDSGKDAGNSDTAAGSEKIKNMQNNTVLSENGGTRIFSTVDDKTVSSLSDFENDDEDIRLFEDGDRDTIEAKNAQAETKKPPKAAKASNSSEEGVKKTHLFPSVKDEKSTGDASGRKKEAAKPAENKIQNKAADKMREQKNRSSAPVGKSSQKASSVGNTSQKRKKKKKSSGLFSGIVKFIVYIVCVVAVSALLANIIIKVANDVFAFVKEDAPITVTFDDGADTKTVAKVLADNGIIEYPGIFRMYTDMKKGRSTYYIEGYKTGEFELNPSMNYDDLIYVLSKNSATREIVRLTFPEGSTVDEIIEILIEGGVQNTKEEYIDVIQNYDFTYRFVQELDDSTLKNGRKYRLEGYLFPDTYDFYTDASAAAVIDKFLVNFNNKFDKSFYDAAYKLDMTVDEIITVASLVEKEARRTDDLGKISSVFHNRLSHSATYPYLQSDATVQYAFPERKAVITPEDLKYDTPYNTYLYKGLPPSAIANPGLDAITNALYPEDTSYYFFVANTRGETLFAKTIDGHNANIAMIQQEKANAN